MTINRASNDVLRHLALRIVKAIPLPSQQQLLSVHRTTGASSSSSYRGSCRRLAVSWFKRSSTKNCRGLRWIQVLCILLAVVIPPHSQSYAKNEKENFVKTTDVEAIEDHQAILYCPLLASNRDKINMVLWFRDNAGIPLYSLDVRGKSLNDAQHWSAPQVFGTRARYVIESDPAYLELNEIKRHDQGIYRCRVDFQNSQTQSFRFNLTVIIPPEPPVVLDRWGRVINSTIIGPKEEGDDILLTCRVVGGRPQPDVLWFINDNLVDNQIEQNTGNVIENRLLWTSVQRHHLHSVFTCQATNTKLMPPRYSKFVLDMYLKPLSVKILNSTLSLAAHKEYRIVCQTSGSRPEASITWTKGKKALKRFKEHVIRNTTVSVLNFVPTVEDDGRLLGCRAQNPKVPGLYLEQFQNISVHYPPVVNIHLGSTLSIDDIKEGDDIYFECKIQSNPAWRRLAWLHNGVQLPQNSSSTKIVRSNQSLVIQKVTRSSSGAYQCGALNTEGETLSDSIVLSIKYVPTCATDKIISLGVSIDETVVISCNIVTHPPASRFTWRFENSEEVIEIDPTQYSNNGTSSLLNYTPSSDRDYGTLSCWGTNEVGTMAEPCIYQLITAGLPTPVINCGWTNTSNAVEVGCHAGYDGGLRQMFVLEMLSSRSPGFGINLTNAEEPTFSTSFMWIREQLPNIHQPDSLKLFAYAVNQKGHSARVFITDLFIPGVEEQEHTESKQSPLLTPILIGLLLTIVVIIFVIVVRIYMKSKRLKQTIDKEKRYTEESKNSLLLLDQSKKDKTQKASKWKNSMGSSIKTRSKIETLEDEQDPDLIPYPRLTDIHQEELIPMNSDISFKPKTVRLPAITPIASTSSTTRVSFKDDDISEAEINLKGIEDFLMTNQVPESCV
ncbi:synaptogenesis protein syg-2-like [Toxorhynchites rutilus septentrionalis]|uniref:synaptogenesis protein syg-2-like n=1 Tax=Toxorhynchites rutilus septentrionalis TaxID=329112 RepID=UPI0024796188|nr:synaptogenesis protein syg-2-like [Toxorhynchites rutilus septentrionalis]